MNIAKQERTVITSVKLGSLAGGNVFHFESVDYDMSVKENAIYMVTTGGKDNRTQIVNLYDGLIMQRDDCHLVCQLCSVMVVI